jgi:hypothetical protein
VSSKSNKPKDNPYKVLYWMAAGLGLLMVGVVALIILRPKPQPDVPRDPERTVLWMYDANNPNTPASVAIIEESRSRATLVAVPFPAPQEAMAVFAPGRGRKAQDEIAGLLDRQMHHRVFLPYSVIGTLIDATDGIILDGDRLSGSAAIAYIHGGGDHAARRATAVMLALAEAATTRGVNMGVTEGLRLMRELDTDMDLTAFPNVLERWSAYSALSVEDPADFAPATLKQYLLPDPATD